ncbi:MAG: AI-2E family transporter [Moraxellaceae bacterium]|nr:AI-2E family transporter [Moraxellaceae bacterium]
MDPLRNQTTRRILLATFIAGLLLLGFQVLHHFIIPVAWGGILVYVTWPLYRRLRSSLRNRHTLAALLMTVTLALSIVLPVLWVAFLLQSEVSGVYQRISQQVVAGHLEVPPLLLDIPWIGQEIKALLDRLQADPTALRNELEAWTTYAANHAAGFVGGVGRNIGKLGFALLTAFFLYREGEAFMVQLRQVLRRVLDERVEDYLKAMGDMTRAVVYGIVLTALAQGLLAGVGYAVAGMSNPVFLGVLTALVALIPFGTPFAWGAVCIWLLLNGQTVPAIGLFLWGTFVVSWVDNIIRPLVISNATQMPFLLVMFGVLGGLAAFGMVGLFIGPVILAVMVAVWREWLDDAVAGAPGDTEVAAGKTPTDPV